MVSSCSQIHIHLMSRAAYGACVRTHVSSSLWCPKVAALVSGGSSTRVTPWLKRESGLLGRRHCVRKISRRCPIDSAPRVSSFGYFCITVRACCRRRCNVVQRGAANAQASSGGATSHVDKYLTGSSTKKQFRSLLGGVIRRITERCVCMQTE